MTCEEIRRYIDWLPRREWHPALRERIERHVATCSACRQAAETAEATESMLGHLPEASAPPGLAEAIAFRISQQAAPGSAAVAVQKRKTNRDRRAWIALVPGAVTAFGAQIYISLSAAAKSDVHLSNGLMGWWLDQLGNLPQTDTAVYVLAAGLLVFTVGLFALPSTDG